MNRVTLVLLALLAVVAAEAITQTAATAPAVSPASSAVDANGSLRVPSNYRDTFQYLGSWSIEAEQGGGAKEMHIVYVSPGTIAAYRASGRFPDGTVLVKEVFGTATGPMTTGNVSHADMLKGWFVMVADSTNARAGSSGLWGDGWGWSWFDADKPTKTTSTDYKAECQGCHIPARATNWIYVQGYPQLRQ